eukprot:gnl/MRDRNA2_/MRDRNA2_299732_c0_seq1.p1 gnl/MRDRNA2_/MRDRNA2_299732_c0~~gnl/MRDRNA2_/MRDRNA2_299732_c0_seq1.p1  ORF type:complete len:132 (-),score=30.47 gnl/MRDRNA2_/MRDRNA2_299732_c0_seq1:57-452(-)
MLGPTWYIEVSKIEHVTTVVEVPKVELVEKTIQVSMVSSSFPQKPAVENHGFIENITLSPVESKDLQIEAIFTTEVQQLQMAFETKCMEIEDALATNKRHSIDRTRELQEMKIEDVVMQMTANSWDKYGSK